MAHRWYHREVDLDQGRSARTRELAIGGAIALTLLFAFRFSTLELLVDDAFISFRYAEMLAQHAQLVFNLGERVEGYSNPLWTLVLAAGIAMGAPPTLLAPALGFIFGLFTLLLVVHGAHRLLDCSLEIALGAAAVVALQPAWCFWAGAGLEAPLFAFELVALWTAVWAFDGWRGALVSALVATSLALTRPEGALLALLVVPALVGRGARPREVAATGGIVLAVLALHLGLRLGYYGSAVPNPVIAKAAFSLAGLERGLAYVGSYLFREGVVFLLPLVVVAPRSKRLLALWALGLVYVVFVVAAGGDGLYRHRLLAHVTPLVVLAAAPGAQWLADRGRTHRLALSVGLAGNLTMPLAWSDFFVGHSLAEVREWETRWADVGTALARAVPADTRLATNVVGRVPYYSRLPTLDLLGLTDPIVAATPIEGRGSGYAGHERAAPEYVLERAPDVIYLSVVDGMPFAALRRLEVVRDVLRRGALFRYTPLIDDPRFARAYAPAELPLPDGHRANVFVRRDGRSGLAAAEWVAP